MYLSVCTALPSDETACSPVKVDELVLPYMPSTPARKYTAYSPLRDCQMQELLKRSQLLTSAPYPDVTGLNYLNQFQYHPPITPRSSTWSLPFSFSHRIMHPTCSAQFILPDMISALMYMSGRSY
jgi:hypothetical protein